MAAHIYLLSLLSVLFAISSAALQVDDRINYYESTRQTEDLTPYFRPEEQQTDTPIIGILTLPVTVASQTKYGTSSFATSYVRWIEAGGARTVPIFYDSSPEELHYVLNRINGVVWTGGLVDFNPEVDDPQGSKYLKTTEYIYKHVVQENEGGHYYPLWGTCLGFERMAQLFANDPNATILETVDAENFPINLQLTSNGWLSRLFGGMSYELFKEVASPVGKLAFNNHGLGIHPDAFKGSAANASFKILSIDEDRAGLPFVSTVEGRRHPLYAVQWHPEKAPWEWSLTYKMTHSEHAVEFSNYLGRFFVNECKYNGNKFENATAVAGMLVANWRSRPTGAVYNINSAYSEITFFGESQQDGALHPQDDTSVLLEPIVSR